MPIPRRDLYKTLALIAGCISLTTACGLGPAYKPPPPPPASLVSISTTALHFGAVPALDVSPPQIVTLTSNSDTATRLGAVSIPFLGAFSQTSNCGFELAPHTSCSIKVVFNPQRLGRDQNFITVNVKPYAGVDVKVDGTGVAKP